MVLHFQRVTTQPSIVRLQLYNQMDETAQALFRLREDGARQMLDCSFHFNYGILSDDSTTRLIYMLASPLPLHSFLVLIGWGARYSGRFSFIIHGAVLHTDRRD